MRLVVVGPGALSPEVEARIHDRVAASLRAFGKRVGRVTVRLHAPTDVDDLWTCHLLVELLPWGGLGLGETGPGALGAVDRAVSRLAGSLASQLRSEPMARSASPRGRWLGPGGG